MVETNAFKIISVCLILGVAELFDIDEHNACACLKLLPELTPFELSPRLSEDPLKEHGSTTNRSKNFFYNQTLTFFFVLA